MLFIFLLRKGAARPFLCPWLAFHHTSLLRATESRTPGRARKCLQQADTLLKVGRFAYSGTTYAKNSRLLHLPRICRGKSIAIRYTFFEKTECVSFHFIPPGAVMVPGTQQVRINICYMNERMDGMEDLWNTLKSHVSLRDTGIWKATCVWGGLLAGSIHFIVFIASSCQDPCSAAFRRKEPSSRFNRCLTLPKVKLEIFLTWWASSLLVIGRLVLRAHHCQIHLPETMTHYCLKDNGHFLKWAFQSLHGLAGTQCTFPTGPPVSLTRMGSLRSTRLPLIPKRRAGHVSWFVCLKICISSGC